MSRSSSTMILGEFITDIMKTSQTPSGKHSLKQVMETMLFDFIMGKNCKLCGIEYFVENDKM